MTPPPDIWARLEEARQRPQLPLPPHLRMTPAQICAEVAQMTPEERERAYTELNEIYRALHRQRRDPEDVTAIFSFIAGLGCIIASPFLGDTGDSAYLAGGVLLVITVISWAISRHFRYHR